nr:Gag-Pol polyprotein [Tanacetum cinerariifolium]
MKDKLSAHQETISILSQQKEAQIKLYKTCKDKELKKVIALENKFMVLDNIVYKTGQSVQTMNMLNNKCRTSFAKPEFLKNAQRANPRLYDKGCYNDNLALMLAPESNEVIRLEKESRSKLSDLIRPFEYTKLNNLYDLFVPQRKKSSEQRYFLERSRLSHTSVNNGNSKDSFNKQTTLLEKRMDKSILLDKKCQSSIEIFKVKTYVNMIFNGVELCKEKIAHRTYSGYLDPFIQNTLLEERMDESIPLDKKCQSSIEIFKVKTYVNMIFNGVELCKEKISHRTYSGYLDPFIQNTIEAKFSPNCVSISTAEFEYVAVSGCCAQVLWMRTQLTDYGFFYDKVPIYYDSKSAIAISCNPVQHTRTKHIDVRYHFIKDHLEKGTIELYFVGTEYQLADLFTKSLPEARFKFLVEKLGMMSRET